MTAGGDGRLRGPRRRGGHPVWSARADGVEVRFVGRGPAHGRAAVLAAVTSASSRPAGPATARQVHSATVLEAAGAGACGTGDALVTDRRRLALSVVTADCVPVLLVGGEGIAAVHAGWRGIVAGVVGATCARLRAAGAPDPGGWRAWIGPAIGVECYEVSAEVAAQVVTASAPEVVRERPGARPHVDLVGAVRAQLAAAGVGRVEAVAACTRCRPDLLWSYRRDGSGAGRNLAFIWRS